MHNKPTLALIDRNRTATAHVATSFASNGTGAFWVNDSVAVAALVQVEDQTSDPANNARANPNAQGSFGKKCGKTGGK